MGSSKSKLKEELPPYKPVENPESSEKALPPYKPVENPSEKQSPPPYSEKEENEEQIKFDLFYVRSAHLTGDAVRKLKTYVYNKEKICEEIIKNHFDRAKYCNIESILDVILSDYPNVKIPDRSLHTISDAKALINFMFIRHNILNCNAKIVVSHNLFHFSSDTHLFPQGIKPQIQRAWRPLSLIDIAILTDNDSLFQELVNKRCDVNSKNDLGCTPLIMCAIYKRNNFIKLLLKEYTGFNLLEKLNTSFSITDSKNTFFDLLDADNVDLVEAVQNYIEKTPQKK